MCAVLKGSARLAWHFDIQQPCRIIEVFSDSDWAGCRTARKSTSGGTIKIG